MDATFQGLTGFKTPTKLNDNGGALQFNQANQQWAQTASPGNLNSFTAEAYYKFDNFNSGDCTAVFTDSYDFGGSAIQFTIGSPGNESRLWGATLQSSSWQNIGFGSNIETSTYHVAVITYNGNSMNFYLDSASVGTSLNISNVASNGTYLNIAKRWDNATNCSGSAKNYFSGRITAIKLLNTSMDSITVANEYRCLTNAPSPTLTLSNSPSNLKKQTSNQTIVATASCPGTVNFSYNNRPINRCSNINANLSGSNFVATCSWKPIIHGQTYLKADMNVNFYPDTVTATMPISVLKRTTSR